MRIGIVAGENSGDAIAADLIRSLKCLYPDAIFEGIAGPQMQAAGCRAIYDIEKLSVMAFSEVLKKLPEILGIRRELKKYFISHPPDVFIGVDAPDFNLALERKLKQQGIRTVHYVSPSAWAWRQYRVKKISRSFNLMLCLLPFEADFYASRGVSVKFVGHPLADQIPFEIDSTAARQTLKLSDQYPVIALLPGSRFSEVSQLLPVMIESAKRCLKQNPALHFVIPAATQKLCRYISEYIVENHVDPKAFTVIDGNARAAMAASDLILLASGTATLEAMLLKKPMVVTYKMSALSFEIFKFFTVVKHVALPNHFDESHPVPEFLQDNATPENLSKALLELLNSPQKRIAMIQNFKKYHEILQQNASEQAANAISSLLEAKNV